MVFLIIVRQMPDLLLLNRKMNLADGVLSLKLKEVAYNTLMHARYIHVIVGQLIFVLFMMKVIEN